MVNGFERVQGEDKMSRVHKKAREELDQLLDDASDGDQYSEVRKPR